MTQEERDQREKELRLPPHQMTNESLKAKVEWYEGSACYYDEQQDARMAWLIRFAIVPYRAEIERREAMQVKV